MQRQLEHQLLLLLPLPFPLRQVEGEAAHPPLSSPDLLRPVARPFLLRRLLRPLFLFPLTSASLASCWLLLRCSAPSAPRGCRAQMRGRCALSSR